MTNNCLEAKKKKDRSEPAEETFVGEFDIACEPGIEG